MPYKSDKQRKYFHYAFEHNKPGFSKEMVNEFDQASKGKKLPEYVKDSRFKRMKKSLKGEK